MTDEVVSQGLEELLEKLEEGCRKILEEKLEKFSKKLLEELLKALEERYGKILEEELKELLKAPREMYRENRSISDQMIPPIIEELLKALKEKYGENSFTISQEPSYYCIVLMGNNELYREFKSIEIYIKPPYLGEALAILHFKYFLLEPKRNNIIDIDDIFGDFCKKYCTQVGTQVGVKSEDLPPDIHINFLLHTVSNKGCPPMYLPIYFNLRNLINLIKTGSFEKMLKKYWEIVKENFEIKKHYIEEDNFESGLT